MTVCPYFPDYPDCVCDSISCVMLCSPAPAPAPAQELRAFGAHSQPSNPSATRDDPLDTAAELTARVNATWAELQRVADDERELVRIPMSKGVLRTALIRAQRDAVARTLAHVQSLIAETLT